MMLGTKWLAGVILVGILTAGANASDEQLDVLRETGSAFSSIAKQALPSVVYIDVESTVEVPQYRHHRHPFEEFFGRGWGGQLEEPEPRKYQQQGQGSGFIISKDGYILTNNHVVNDADKITVTLGDGREFQAKLIGTDPKSEVALIKIENGDDLPFLTLGDSDALEVGAWVLAAGNPFGLSQTVTAGIVSAKERNDVGIAEYGNFIQTDAAINPGNSGGPLLNIDGDVVGINTAIYTRTGGYMGIGFAIPINMAIDIKDQLIAHGKVQRSVLGIFIDDVDEDLANVFGFEERGGIVISQIIEDSAAEKAGLKEGDIVVEMNGEKVGARGAFRNKVAATPPHTKLKLKIFRDGKYKTVVATTQPLDGESVERAEEDDSLYEELGIEVEQLEAQQARRMGLDKGEGLLVSGVKRGSAAWREGLKPGLVILSVNRESVGSVREFKKALRKTEENKLVLLLVSDGRSSRFVVVSMK